MGSAAFYLLALLFRIVFGPNWTVFSLIPLTVGLPLLLSYLFQRFRRFAGTGYCGGCQPLFIDWFPIVTTEAFQSFSS